MMTVRAFSALRTFASSAKEGLLRGAVHIRVLPRPRNLGESREILRVLEKYGEVLMFKHLKVCIVQPYYLHRTKIKD